jgi:hypothetical protein
VPAYCQFCFVNIGCFAVFDKFVLYHVDLWTAVPNQIKLYEYSDWGISKKGTCARTKTEDTVNNVLAPHSAVMAIQDLNEILSYLCVSTDGSNHDSLKLPISCCDTIFS